MLVTNCARLDSRTFWKNIWTYYKILRFIIIPLESAIDTLQNAHNKSKILRKLDKCDIVNSTTGTPNHISLIFIWTNQDSSFYKLFES